MERKILGCSQLCFALSFTLGVFQLKNKNKIKIHLAQLLSVSTDNSVWRQRFNYFDGLLPLHCFITTMPRSVVCSEFHPSKNRISDYKYKCEPWFVSRPAVT